MKKQLIISQLNKDVEEYDLANNKEFLQHYKACLLLALLEQKKLTQRQYDRCVELLKKSI